ncbi:carbohydrate binding family 9 domain-containing protein [bacterium]|nr:carbohydrate binding family 9 domain-containing protein [bacterium]
MLKRPCLPVHVFILFAVSILTAQQKDVLRPYKTDTPPVIDGVLDDAVWAQAPSETGFMTYQPDYGVPMSEETRVWYAYDRENIYFAFLCYDREPDKIKTSITARDKIRSDDWICINLDTYNDHQGIYAFYVNPQGIQGDSRAVGDEEDANVDFVWYSHGTITDDGYSIEMKIPFKSIRYSDGDPVTMGVIFERYISRRTEAGTYPALDPKWGPNFITQTRPLLYEGIRHYRLLEVLPAVTWARNSYDEAGSLKTGDGKGELSLTGKLGLTSRLILDATYNPDFSQVEADAGQVDFNQRYALFYEEKRPFFLEGRDQFIFGGSSEGDPLGAVVHTRSIANPLLGTKLTGKISPTGTIAAIYARDELVNNGTDQGYADVQIIRHKKSLDRDSFVGSFYTARERENGYNRVVGGDGYLRLTRSSRLGYHGFLSWDENRETDTRQKGHAVGINYLYSNRDWLVNARIHDLSERFNTEVGYLTRTGITRYRLGIIRRIFTDSAVIQRIDPLLNNQFIKDKETGEWENENAFYATFVLPRNSAFRAGYLNATEIFLGKKFETSGYNLIAQSQISKSFFFSLTWSDRKKIRYVADPFQCRGGTGSASLVYQPNQNLNATVSVVYSDLYRADDGTKVFDYAIVRSRNTYQVNRYLFLRAIVEYNSFYEQLTTDFLVSFTYIPGTVIHLGYGSRYDRIEWNEDQYIASDRFLETQRGLFFKASYLWRM